jgi:hypothetical protein
MSISAGVSGKWPPGPRSALGHSVLINPHYFMMKILGGAVIYGAGPPPAREVDNPSKNLITKKSKKLH